MRSLAYVINLIYYIIVTADKKIIKNERIKVSKRTARYGVKLQLEKVNWDKVEKIFANDRRYIVNFLNRKEENIPHTGEILKLLAGGAVIALSFLIPALPMALAPFIVDSNKYDRGQFNQAIKRLKKQKLVKIIEEDGQTVVRITEAGRIRALRYKLEEMQVKKPKVWDRRWRLVIFDIPEKYKRMREIFRDHLKGMDFYMLQKSVWVHPYPCFSEIEFLRQIYNVGINVTYVVAERVEGSADLSDYYQLH